MRYHDSDSFYMAYGSLTLREVIHFFLNDFDSWTVDVAPGEECLSTI